MTQHHGYAAIGFILNKPMSAELKEKYQARFPKLKHFHYGGPVGENEEFFLMVLDSEGVSGYTVYNGQLLQEKKPEKFNEIIQSDATRIFSGYAGWGPMQLNREIYRGYWDILPFQKEYVSTENGSVIYERALLRVLDEKNDIVDAI